MLMNKRENVLIIDANSLIYAIKDKIDLIGLIRNLRVMYVPAILQCTIIELRSLSRSNLFARAALRLFSDLKVLESSGKGDECIINTAVRFGYSVLTNDRSLAHRLKEAGAKVLSIRDRRFIKEVGG